MSRETVCRVDTPVDGTVLTGCGEGQGGGVAVTLGQADDSSEKPILHPSYVHTLASLQASLWTFSNFREIIMSLLKVQFGI